MIGVAADVGGTHARFAAVDIDSRGKAALKDVSTWSSTEFPDFESAFEAFVAKLPARPRTASLALASPVAGEEIKLTNSSWTLAPKTLANRLQLDRIFLLNDFEAIARSITAMPSTAFAPVGRAQFDLPERGAVSVVGPGSGLGVGLLLRTPGGDEVMASEGGHAGFSPTDEIDLHIMRRLLARHGRVSAERLISGPGLIEIYNALAEWDELSATSMSDVSLWTSAIEGGDPLARSAIKRWLVHLGAFAGDVALTHGAGAVVLAGGILPRLAGRVDLEPIVRSFLAKGRFRAYMENVGLALLTHPQPGLLGAASLLVEEVSSAWTARHIEMSL